MDKLQVLSDYAECVHEIDILLAHVQRMSGSDSREAQFESMSERVFVYVACAVHNFR